MGADDRSLRDQFRRIERVRWSRDEGPWAAIQGRDSIACEEPLEIRIRGKNVAVTMRTPGNDPELAVGFLLTEGLICKREDVVEVAHCTTGESAKTGNVINVFLAPDVEVDPARLMRHGFVSSSCGVCGKASIDAVHQHFAPVTPSWRIDREILTRLGEMLRPQQMLFEQTGGVHGAAVFHHSGRLVALREDVGRHNAVDKVIGCGLLSGGLPWDQHGLWVSGRVSFEIMQKALAARIGLVAAVSAPTSLAVEFAEESGQTLVGFMRAGRLSVYSHPERIQ